MVRGERDDVVVGADGLVQGVEEPSDHEIEANQHVLHFVAARTKRVSHVVEGREPDGEKVGRISSTKADTIGERGTQLAEIRVSHRRHVPYRCERHSDGGTENVGKCTRSRFTRSSIFMTVALR